MEEIVRLYAITRAEARACGTLRRMKRRPLGSSVLAAAGYDPDHQVLELAFANGRVYRYTQVPELVYWRLLRAPSAGIYFNTEIRDQYPSQLVDRDDHESTARR
jgi:hypothetical protein